MTYELAGCAHSGTAPAPGSGDDGAEQHGGGGAGGGVVWRRRAVSLCDVTWEPVCVLKFLSEVRQHAVVTTETVATKGARASQVT